MTAAILEIRDGMATGPLHQPVPAIPGKHFDDDAFEWPTLCGLVGYAYQREPLAALGHTVECWECRVAAEAPPVVAPVVGRRRTCEGCGAPLSPKASRFCRPCYRAQRPKPRCGTNSAYTSGCRCDACRKASRDYHREHKRTIRALARRKA